MSGHCLILAISAQVCLTVKECMRMCTNFGMVLLVLIRKNLSCPQLHLSLSKKIMEILHMHYSKSSRGAFSSSRCHAVVVEGIFLPQRSFTGPGCCICSVQLTHPSWGFGGETSSPSCPNPLHQPTLTLTQAVPNPN